MKKLFLLFALAVFAVELSAQIEVKKEEFPSYQGVVTVDGKSASDLYSGLKLWMAEAFVSAQDVLQLDDKDNALLVIKGNIPVTIKIMTGPYTFHAQLSIRLESKDNRFRYTIEVNHIVDPAAPNAGDMINTINKKPNSKYAIGAIEQTTASVNALVQNMYSKLNSTLSPTEEDW
ncbi:MAG: DUF4468 domain-containing protein [Bacteroidales bacterium]|nr:DUF4468 domain-containing protein [Candidatus Colicola faecequi]